MRGQVGEGNDDAVGMRRHIKAFRKIAVICVPCDFKSIAVVFIQILLPNLVKQNHFLGDFSGWCASCLWYECCVIWISNDARQILRAMSFSIIFTHKIITNSKIIDATHKWQITDPIFIYLNLFFVSNRYHRVSLSCLCLHLNQGCAEVVVVISHSHFWLKVHDFEYFICLAIFCALSFRCRRSFDIDTHTRSCRIPWRASLMLYTSNPTIDTFPCQNIFSSYEPNHLTFKTCSPFSVDGDNFFPPFQPKQHILTEEFPIESVRTVTAIFLVFTVLYARSQRIDLLASAVAKKKASQQDPAFRNTMSEWCEREESRIKYQLAYGAACTMLHAEHITLPWCAQIEIGGSRGGKKRIRQPNSFITKWNFLSCCNFVSFQSRPSNCLRWTFLPDSLSAKMAEVCRANCL